MSKGMATSLFYGALLLIVMAGIFLYVIPRSWEKDEEKAVKKKLYIIWILSAIIFLISLAVLIIDPRTKII